MSEPVFCPSCGYVRRFEPDGNKCLEGFGMACNPCSEWLLGPRGVE